VKRSIVVAALGTAQTLAWGSSYYLPAILADPIAHGLGLSRTTVFGLSRARCFYRRSWALPSAARSTTGVAAACWSCPIWSSRRGWSCSAPRRDFHPGSGLGRARHRHGHGAL
jgi:hypothetical protein